MSVMDLATKRLNLDGVLGFIKRTVSGNKKEIAPIVPEQPKTENLIETPVVRIECKTPGRWSDIKAAFRPNVKVSLKKGIYTFSRIRESVRGIMQNLKASKSKVPDQSMSRSYERSDVPRWDLKEARIWELIPVCAVKKLPSAKLFTLPANIHCSQLKKLIRSSAGAIKKLPPMLVTKKTHDFRPPLGTFGVGVAS